MTKSALPGNAIRAKVQFDIEFFGSGLDYALDDPCPTCGVAAGSECNTKLRGAQNVGPGVVGVASDRYAWQHPLRRKIADAHYLDDVAKAPHPGGRRPGQKYNTLKRKP